MATHWSHSSSRPGPPVTQVSAPAFTAASSTRRPHLRCCRRSSARSPSARPRCPTAHTPPPCSPSRRGQGKRCGRRRRRSPAPPARRPTRGSPKRPPTCCTTSRCCSGDATCHSPTPSACSMAVAHAEQQATRPTLAQVRALARDHNVIPLHQTFIDDCQTPVSAFLKLRELPFNAREPGFLLESADQGRVGRYSFIGFRPRKVLRWSLGDPGDPYELAAAELGRFRVAELPDLPPFAGGAVGMFAYDLVRTVEPLGEPNPDPIGVPDLALMLTDALVVFDHLKHTVTVLANAYADEHP